MIRVVRVSGTIRKAEEEAVRRARAEIVRVKLDREASGRLGRGILDHLTGEVDDASLKQPFANDTEKAANPEVDFESFDDDDMEED